MSEKNTLKNYLQNNSLPIVMQILTVASLIIALYITARLAPLAQDVAVIATKVEANEKEDYLQHPGFVTRDELKGLVDDVKDIKSYLLNSK